jgi:hypothetical protein
MSDPNRREEKQRLRQAQQLQYNTMIAELPEFVGFPKIGRLNRDISITEKIDGTNAAIGITPDGRVYAQSRTRIITPEQDNQGFARWVEENADALRATFGPGIHFGEWWGRGIQRGYGLEGRRFSLFNFTQWSNDPSVGALASIGVQVIPILYHGPWNTGDAYLYAPDTCLRFLAQRGSMAQPGYKLVEYEGELVDGAELPRGYFRERFTGKVCKNDVGPEGIVVFHQQGGVLFKATLENDEQHKFEKSAELLQTGDVTDQDIEAALRDDEINPEA